MDRLSNTPTASARAGVVRRLAAAWSVVMLLILGIGAAVLTSGRAADAADERVLRGMHAQHAIDDMLDVLIELETGQRGYVLTEDREFLAPYHEALELLGPRTLALRDALQTEGVSPTSVSTLEELIDARVESAARTVTLVDAGDRDSAVALVRAGEGRRRMARVREAIAALDAQQLERVEARVHAARVSRTQAWFGVVAGILLATFVAGYSGVRAVRDLSALDRASRAVAENERRFRAIAESASDLVRLHARDGAVLYVSPSVEKLLGYSPDDLAALDPPREIPSPDAERVSETVTAFFARNESPPPIVHRLQHKDGRYRFFETRLDPLLEDGQTVGYQAVSRDVTARIAHERDLRERADELTRLSLELRDRSERDALTKLFNREGFFTHGEALMRAHLHAGRECTLVFADLDGLKAINDTLGHDVGDAAITEGATMLRETARSSDLVARLGGDEMVILAPGGGEDVVQAWRARLDARIAARNAEPGRKYTLAISVGHVIVGPESGESLAEVLARADEQMYEEKKARRSKRGEVKGIIRS